MSGGPLYQFKTAGTPLQAQPGALLVDVPVQIVRRITHEGADLIPAGQPDNQRVGDRFYFHPLNRAVAKRVQRVRRGMEPSGGVYSLGIFLCLP